MSNNYSKSKNYESDYSKSKNCKDSAYDESHLKNSNSKTGQAKNKSSENSYSKNSYKNGYRIVTKMKIQMNKKIIWFSKKFRKIVYS